VVGYYRYIEYRFGEGNRPELPVKGAGWGHVAPHLLPMYGDGTDEFYNARWSDWGQSVAYGYGMTLGFWPRGGHVGLAAEIKATDLGRCHGTLAYRHLEERLLLKPGTRRYRDFGQRKSHRWRNYGLPGDHGKVCRGPHVMP
jgi:hypothetical protein